MAPRHHSHPSAGGRTSLTARARRRPDRSWHSSSFEARGLYVLKGRPIPTRPRCPLLQRTPGPQRLGKTSAIIRAVQQGSVRRAPQNVRPPARGGRLGEGGNVGLDVAASPRNQAPPSGLDANPHRPAAAEGGVGLPRRVPRAGCPARIPGRVVAVKSDRSVDVATGAGERRRGARDDGARHARLDRRDDHAPTPGAASSCRRTSSASR